MELNKEVSGLISCYQLFCILLLSRLSSEIVFVNSNGFDSTGFAAALITEALRLLLATPFIIYSLRGRDIYAAAAAKSRVLGAVFGFVAAVYAVYIAVMTVFYTAEFAQRTIVSGMSAAVLGVMIAAFAIYTAGKGAEGAARAGVLFLIVAGIVTAAVIFADIPHMRARDIGGAELSEQMWSQTLGNFKRGGEYLIFAALLPRVKKGAGSAVMTYALIAAVGVLLIGVFNMSVLGEYYGRTEYPFIAAAQLADIALFKRLDGFAGAVWTLCAAFKCGLLLHAAYRTLESALFTGRKREAA